MLRMPPHVQVTESPGIPAWFIRNMTKVRENDMEPKEDPGGIPQPDLRRIWLRAGVPGLAVWAVALLLCAQGDLDRWALFYRYRARGA